MPASAIEETTGFRPGAQNASMQWAIAFSPLTADRPAGSETVRSGS